MLTSIWTTMFSNVIEPESEKNNALVIELLISFILSFSNLLTIFNIHYDEK